MDCCRSVNPFAVCSGPLKALGYAMLLLVAAIAALSYYAVVIVSWGPKLLPANAGRNSVLAFAVVAVSHLLLALIIWSYCMVVFSDPGAVPENWRPMLEEDSLGTASPTALSGYIIPESRDLPSSTSEDLERRQTMRFCTRCQNGKPPRCHHCSVCDRCVLKMDHHCVWVVNCVGARNYKFFLLFLVYTFLETVLDTLALLPHFIGFFGDARKHSGSPSNLAITFLAFVLNLAFSLSLLCFLCMHASLVLSNTTSIEIYEKKKAVAWKYDLGKKKNFEQVFGTNKLLWFLPLYTAADQENIPALQGLDFPTRSDVEV
ncbi:probable protein S-acyltransferase 12 [Ananas comosus]|uniref:S-acyltransferase n=1 Tax=Ananas comosus TaxID=4615 RepID=A0A6P5FST8_ANACO|nr:probable protein S-acyltransferase 12 [Ananas comosus]